MLDTTEERISKMKDGSKELTRMQHRGWGMKKLEKKKERG